MNTENVIVEELLDTIRRSVFKFSIEDTSRDLDVRLWENWHGAEESPRSYVRLVVDDNTVRIYAVENGSAIGIDVTFTNTYPSPTAFHAIVSDQLATI